MLLFFSRAIPLAGEREICMAEKRKEMLLENSKFLFIPTK